MGKNKNEDGVKQGCLNPVQIFKRLKSINRSKKEEPTIGPRGAIQDVQNSHQRGLNDEIINSSLKQGVQSFPTSIKNEEELQNLFPIIINSYQELEENYQTLKKLKQQLITDKQPSEKFFDAQPAPSSQTASDSGPSLPPSPEKQIFHDKNSQDQNNTHDEPQKFTSEPQFPIISKENEHMQKFETVPQFPMTTQKQEIEPPSSVVEFHPLSYRDVDIKQVRQTGKILNNFSLKLNLVLYKNGNCVFSPFSIFNALGLVIEGTQGATRDQILKMLDMHEIQIQDIRNNYYNFISNVLYTTKKSFKLFSANRFYGNSNVNFSQEYKNTLVKYYNADSINANFEQNPENERKNINAWIQNVTKNQIQELMPPNSISNLSVAVLVNALFFEGSWDEVFDPKKNQMREFTTKKGEKKMVEMMVQKQMYYYVQSDFSDIETNIKCVSIKLPYDNRAATFHVVLPLYEDEDGEQNSGPESPPKKPKMSKIDRLLADLDEENLQYILKYGQEELVDLYLPKFSVDFSTTMSAPLKQLGMEDAFDSQKANFEGMLDQNLNSNQNQNSNSNNLYITEGYHKTKITVDETGTVAASAMAFGVARGMPPRARQFDVNQPFLFMVVHESSKTIIFSGVVDDPTMG